MGQRNESEAESGTDEAYFKEEQHPPLLVVILMILCIYLAVILTGAGES